MTSPAIHASPDDVERAFYQALAAGDAEKISQLWAEDEEIVCVHPTGIRLTDLAPIRNSWRGILANTRLRVQVRVVTQWRGSMLAIHHLNETLFVGKEQNPQSTLYVTHVYTRGPHGWRLACRHASAVDNKRQTLVDAQPHTFH
ncbi:MAG: nuclear transport factor 2 family protein [Azonexus sp.]|jgi:ketosteroid isomerase-like protein|nr:nuclear transport factor 2 family protein [Azonexus sp.]